MIRCPSCSAEVPDGSHFCPSCGEAVSLSSPSRLPTNLASPSVAEAARRRGRGPASSSVVGRLASSDSIDAGGFTPGTILAERYRVIGLIGRGGMGEVYRADDLKLGQAVALKFLPERLSSDATLLDRLFAEVRTARQVSHPNVCRVYDVGETDGRHFLSMEYVDGEDLASLLRRIGGLPQAKALEIARQLCAGLAAAHERNVLHRDLKPANVMVDGRGRARIMDFGLAVVGDEGQAGAEIAGTPAYMAPEQFAGKGASVRSDLYALGLVLFELFTGRHAFDAASVAGYRQKHAEETPASPSVLVPGIDPAVERAILRCVEKDPKMRPATAAQVAAALPGGDPLAAALAAGETPSPEMVAAAGSEDRLSPGVARGLATAAVAIMLVHAFLAARVGLLPVAGSEKSGEVLRVRAREILASLGMPERPADWAGALEGDLQFVTWISEHDTSRERWRRVSRDALTYVYREGPLPLVPTALRGGPFPQPIVTDTDPPPLRTGMKEVRLDSEGRLKELHVVPPQVQNSSATAEAVSVADWTPLFRAAALDIGTFRPVAPRWNPREYADARAAWEGPHPEHPGITMRVEAAAYRGRFVSFLWIGPWSTSSQDVFDQRPGGERAGDLVWAAILMTLLFGGAWMARRNVRAGRGDRRGAARLAAAVVLVQLAMWVLGAHHVSTVDELDVFVSGLADAAVMGAVIWIVYVALEPIMRRHWPGMLISWTRLLAGGWSDPLVGRDLLVGASAGALIGILMGPIRRYIPLWLGEPAPMPRGFLADPSSVRSGLAWLLSAPALAIWWVLGIVMFLVIVRRIVRLEWLAAIMVSVLFTANSLGAPLPRVTLPMAAVTTGILVVIAIRFGLLAALVCRTCDFWLEYWVMTPDPAAWYFYVGAIAIVLVAALALWGLRTTTQGAPSPERGLG